MTNSQIIPPSLACLHQTSRDVPNAWRLADQQRKAKDWPGWCFLPGLRWVAVLQDTFGPFPTWEDSKGAYVYLLAALGAWRSTQDICRFEPNLYEAVCSTPLEAELPCEVLFRLPAWCLYIETPGLSYRSTPLDGFWVSLEYTGPDTTPELWMILLAQNRQLFPVILDLGAWPLQEALERSIQNAAAGGLPHQQLSAQEKADVVRSLRALVNLTLYMCSDKPDVNSALPLRRQPSAKKVKGGLRFFPPDSPNIILVGEKFEEEFASRDRGSTEHPHGRPRPHVRRAHWHHFWRGSRKEAEYGKPGQELIIRWVSAHFVGKNPSEDEEAD